MAGQRPSRLRALRRVFRRESARRRRPREGNGGSEDRPPQRREPRRLRAADRGPESPSPVGRREASRSSRQASADTPPVKSRRETRPPTGSRRRRVARAHGVGSRCHRRCGRRAETSLRRRGRVRGPNPLRTSGQRARGPESGEAVRLGSALDRLIGRAARHLLSRLLAHRNHRVGKAADTADVIPVPVGYQHMPNRSGKLQRPATYPGHFVCRDRRVDDKRLTFREHEKRGRSPKESLEAFPTGRHLSSHPPSPCRATPKRRVMGSPRGSGRAHLV